MARTRTGFCEILKSNDKQSSVSRSVKNDTKIRTKISKRKKSHVKYIKYDNHLYFQLD